MLKEEHKLHDARNCIGCPCRCSIKSRQ